MAVERDLSMYYAGVLTTGRILQAWDRKYYDVDCSANNISITLPDLPSATAVTTSGSIMIRRIDNTSNTLTIKWTYGGINRSKTISDTTGTYWFMALSDPYAEDPLLITRLTETGGGGGSGGGGGTLSTRVSTQAVLSTDSFILVDSVDGFPDTGYLLIGSEMIRYDIKQASPPGFGLLQRGSFGSVAAGYPIGTEVDLSAGLAFSDFIPDRVIITDPTTGQMTTSTVSGTVLSYLDINSSLTGLLNDRLSLTGGNMTGNIDISGSSVFLPIRNGNTTLGYNDNGALLDASVGLFTVTLPDIVTGVLPSPVRHCQLYYLIKIDSSANAITIQPSGTDTINNGQTSLDLTTQDEWCMLIGDPNNTDWRVLKGSSSGGGSSAPVSVVVNGVVTSSSGIPTVDGIYAFNIAGSGSSSSVLAGDIARLNSGVWTVSYASTQNKVIVVYNSGNSSVFTKNGNGWTEVLDGNELDLLIKNIAFSIPSFPPVAFASTANLPLSGLSAVDGYTPVSGDTCLVKNQTNLHDNGIYFASAGTWLRAKYNSLTNTWANLTGSDTTYNDLNIDNGVVYVNGGTANKNVQYQCSITNKNHTLGSNTVTVLFTSRRVSSNRDIFNGYVSVNTGSNSQGNGTQGYPYATMGQDLSGASYPHTTNIAASGSALTESLSLASSQSNIIFQTYDHSVVGGKLSISGTQTHLTGNTRVTWKGIILNGGANPPLVYNTGNLYRHNLENITLQTTGSSLMTLGADATNWINIRAIDLNAPAATIPLPVMTGTFALNIYNQTTRLPISGVGGVNTTINMFNCTESVRVYSTFAGNLNWNGQAFDYVVNGVITSAAQLNALMTYITDTTQDGYWLLSGFSYSPITCTGASGTGSIATISFPAQSSAPFAIGSSITVSGFTPSGYNGTYIVTNCTTTSVSYANTTTGVPSVFGTVIQKSFSGGDIIGKQTAAGIATETWYARTYAQAPACAKATGGLVYFKGPGGTWSLPNSGASTTLTASVTSTSTSLPVTSTQAFPSSGAVTIDSEVIYYSSKTTTSFTGLTRGFAGTTAAAHVSGSLVLSNQDSTTQDKVIWDFSVNNWTAATVPMSGVYPSGTFTAGGLFSIAISVGTDGFTQALVTSSSSVTAGNCIVGIPKVIPDELKTSTRLPTLKALFDVNSSNLSLLGSTTDSLGFGLMCYGSTGTFIGFYSCTKSAFVLPNTTNFGDSSIDTVQLPSNVYSAAPIFYCANSITGAVSFGLKRVVLQKELFGSLPSVVNQQIDQITQFGMNSILIRSNGKVYSTMSNTATISGFTGRSAQGYGFPQYYGMRNLSDIPLPGGETSAAIDCGTGFEFNYILCANGNLYVWGHNAYGQLGLGNSNIYYTPTLSATGVVKVFYGNEQSQYQYDATRAFILKSDGYIYGCGYNGTGGLGIGNTTATINTWTQITAIGQNPISLWNLGSSYGCTFVQKSDGTIWFTGYDGYGQSGSGSTSTGRASFINVTSAWTGGNSAMRIRQATGGFGFVDSTAQSYSYVIMSLSDGSTSRIAAAGSNNWGNLGDGTTTDRTTPVVPNIGSGTVQKIHVAGGGAGTVGVLKTNGDYWSWGHNAYGYVGDGTTTNRPTPALRLSGVIDLPIVNCTTPGYGWYTQMFVQKNDGLYVVGNNDNGYCGTGVYGSAITTFTRVLLPNNLTFKMIGFYSSETAGKIYVAVMSDNSIYAWGYNAKNGVVPEHTYNCVSPQRFSFGTPQYSSSSIITASNIANGDETIIVASSRLQGTTNVAFDFLQPLSNKTSYWSGTQYKAPRNQKVTVSGVFQRTSGDCNVWLWKNNVKYAALCGLFDVYNRAFSLSVDLTAGDVIDLRPDNNIQISGGTSAPYGTILCITPDYQNQIVQTDPTYLSKVKWGAPQSTTSGSDTKLTPGVVDADSGNIWSTVSNRFNIPANGTYEIKVYMIGGSLTGEWWRVKWRKNGLLSTEESFASALPGSRYWPDAQGSVIIPNLKSGDYIELYTAGSGATISAGFISLLRVGNL